MKIDKKSSLFLLGNVFYFCLVLCVFPACYKQNDDVFMSWIASGVGVPSGLPNEHLVFIHYYIGIFLSNMYLLLPNIEWYSLLLVLIHFISFNVLVFCLINASKEKWIKLMFLLIFYAFEFRILFWLQFTTTAAIAATAGLLLCIKFNKKSIVLGVILFLVGLLLRYHAAMLVGLISAIYIVLFYRKLELKLKRIYPLVCLVLVGFLFNSINNQYYLNETNWNRFYHYNALRSKINDNPNYNLDKIIIPESVSSNDLFFIDFFCVNPEIVDQSVLQNIFNQIDKIPITDKIANISGIFKGKILMFFLILLFVLSCVLAFYQKNISFIVSYFLFLFLCFYISSSGTLKMRVFFTMLLPCLMFIYLLLNNSKLVIKGIIVLFFIGFSTYSVAAVEKVNNKLPLLDEQVKLINSVNISNTIVPLGASLYMELFPTFKITTLLKPKLGMIDCYVPSPITENLNSHVAFIDSSIYLFSTSGAYQSRSKMFIQEFKEHYKLETEINILKKSDNFVIFNFKTVDQ